MTTTLAASHPSLGLFASEVYSLLCSLEPDVVLSPTEILDQLGYPETSRKDFYSALRRLANGSLSHCVDRSAPVMRYGRQTRYFLWHRPRATDENSPQIPYFLRNMTEMQTQFKDLKSQFEQLCELVAGQLVANIQTQINELRSGLNELRSGIAELRSEMAKLRACLPSP